MASRDKNSRAKHNEAVAREATPRSRHAFDGDFPAQPSRWRWMTRAAFAIVLAVVIARLLMLETIRQAFDVVQGGTAGPTGPGPAAGVVIDLLACAAPLLVLARSAIDRTFALRGSRAMLGLAAFVLWICASIGWADDKFLAAVTASHFVGAAAILWATFQVVRTPRHLRIVAGACVGLLLALSAHGLIYRTVEMPDMRADWQQNKEKYLQERGWEPGSFAAIQFEKRVLNGELIGFSASPNTYAALLVFLGIITAGAAAQRVHDRDQWGWATALIVPLIAAAICIRFTDSKTAYVTPVLGALLLAAAWGMRATLARHRRLAFLVGVLIALLGVAAIVGHGLYHGSLPTDSLAFRWKYWIATGRMIASHPFAGAGWSNFGQHYLAVRLPAAAEEIKDPHNFFVRVTAELGLVGLALTLAWLALLAWELTVRANSRAVEDVAHIPGASNGAGTESARSSVIPYRQPHPRPSRPGHGKSDGAALAAIAGIAVLGILLNIAASVDFSQSSTAFVAIELLRRGLSLVLLLAGLGVASFQSTHDQQFDDRPAPLLRMAMIVAATIFLLHNMVDVSMGEPGPLAAMMLVLGSCLGVQWGGSPTSNRSGTKAFFRLSVLAVALLLWSIVAIGWAVPLVIAEQLAGQGDEMVRTGLRSEGVAKFRQAFDALPIPNADYIGRAAKSAWGANQEDPQVPLMIDQAVTADPSAIGYRRMRAAFALTRHPPDANRIREDYDFYLLHNPNDVQARLEYGDVLRALDDAASAAAQYRTALDFDDLLDKMEPKRLDAAHRAEVTAKIEAIEKRAATQPAMR